MKLNKRSIVQIIITFFVLVNCIFYKLYLNDIVSIKIMSLGDLNPYGGWSALKSLVTDASYKYRGITKSIALTISIMITSFFMGRFFCGFICPIGALQDFFKFLGSNLKIKEKKIWENKYFNPEIIKYFILLVAVVLSCLNLGNIIAPYSPWATYLNLFIGFSLNMGTFILIMIIFFSLFFKRIFCRVFCPLGAFQSLLYALGPLKLKKSKSCGICVKCFNDCPVDIKNTEELISPECVNCTSCCEYKCIHKDSNRSACNVEFAKNPISNKKYIILSSLVFTSVYLILLIYPLSFQTNFTESSLKFKDGIYGGEGMGFGGSIFTEINVEDGQIKNIKIINQNETQGFYEEAFKQISQEIVEKQNFNVDIVSGATASSRGILNSVKQAISKSLE